MGGDFSVYLRPHARPRGAREGVRGEETAGEGGRGRGGKAQQGREQRVLPASLTQPSFKCNFNSATHSVNYMLLVQSMSQ